MMRVLAMKSTERHDIIFFNIAGKTIREIEEDIINLACKGFDSHVVWSAGEPILKAHKCSWGEW